MRTVTFSNAKVQQVLNNDFVCCYTNTKGDASAGHSFSHSPDSEPGPCGRGAGRQNVQTIFMTPDNQIFHVATGYLDPDDLLDEIKFAKGLFASIQRNPKRDKTTVVAAHQRQLKTLGFTANQIAAPENRLTESLLSGPNPQDFGINLGPAGGIFSNISQQRVLKDHKFAISHPLITRKEFERNPQSLVGHNRSFFGSHPGMNMLSDKAIFNPPNRRRTVERK